VNESNEAPMTSSRCPDLVAGDPPREGLRRVGPVDGHLTGLQRFRLSRAAAKHAGSLTPVDARFSVDRDRSVRGNCGDGDFATAADDVASTGPGPKAHAVRRHRASFVCVRGSGGRTAEHCFRVGLVLQARGGRKLGDGKRDGGGEAPGGGSLVARGVTLCGDLDLAGADVKGLFECRGCSLSGRLLAAEAIFRSTVDLSGTRVARLVDMQGARFQRPAVFDIGPTGSPTMFDGRVDCSLTTFRELAAFGEARFARTATFNFARFGGDAVFDLASFASASFSSAHFDGRASFAGLGAEFTGKTTFASAAFARDAVFTQTEFDDHTAFDGARFANNGIFIGADFTSVSFDDVRAAGSLDLTGVSADSASFTDTVADSVSLRDATFSRSGIVLYRVGIRDIDLAVDDVTYVKGEPSVTLKLIEQSAKNRGDLAVANDAYFKERVLASDRHDPVAHGLDLFFYRWAAGYLVRPWNPLLALLIVAVTVAAIRMVWRGFHRATPTAAGAKLSWTQRAGRHMVVGGNAMLDTAGTVLPGRADVADSDSLRLLHRVERFAYRALIVCAVIALANSNPSLRQVLDSLR
jgi:hypothetical protein